MLCVPIAASSVFSTFAEYKNYPRLASYMSVKGANINLEEVHYHPPLSHHPASYAVYHLTCSQHRAALRATHVNKCPSSY